MAITGYNRVCGKKSGGIKSIALIESDKIVSATLDAARESYTQIILQNYSLFKKYDFAEDEAEYIESVKLQNGSVVVAHQLTLYLDRMSIESRRAIHELIAGGTCGVVAMITTVNNLTLLVGYSEEFATERALKLVESIDSSGKKLADRCGETVTLYSTDTEKARIFSGNYEVVTA